MTPKQQALIVAEEEPAALMPTPIADGYSALIARLATDPSADVGKLERLLAIRQEIMAQDAKVAFDAAMSQAQSEMRRITTDATNPQTRSRYVTYGALDRYLRPIYTKHGFALSFNTGEAPTAECVRVLCDVSHRGGHSRSYHIDMPADGKGAKGGDVMTKTHAVGSAASYGMRYLLKMIFNVAVGEDDDDGNAAAQTVATPPPPDGWQRWADDMEAVASTGMPAFNDAWKKSKPEFTAYALKHRTSLCNGWKARAAKAVARG